MSVLDVLLQAKTFTDLKIRSNDMDEELQVVKHGSAEKFGSLCHFLSLRHLRPFLSVLAILHWEFIVFCYLQFKVMISAKEGVCIKFILSPGKNVITISAYRVKYYIYSRNISK